MRNMSFMMTTEAMLNGTKTVTRRLGWQFLKPGDIVMAVKKGMGLKKGEKVEKLYPIEIISIRSEPLSDITQEECLREGFPNFCPEEFMLMFCIYHHKKPSDMVNRIEFKSRKDLLCQSKITNLK